jgi:hypothetical protein
MEESMTVRDDRRLRLCRAIMTINILVGIVTLIATMLSARGNLAGSPFESPVPRGIADWPSHHHPQDPTL